VSTAVKRGTRHEDRGSYLQDLAFTPNCKQHVDRLSTEYILDCKGVPHPLRPLLLPRSV